MNETTRNIVTTSVAWQSILNCTKKTQLLSPRGLTTGSSAKLLKSFAFFLDPAIKSREDKRLGSREDSICLSKLFINISISFIVLFSSAFASDLSVDEAFAQVGCPSPKSSDYKPFSFTGNDLLRSSFSYELPTIPESFASLPFVEPAVILNPNDKRIRVELNSGPTPPKKQRIEQAINSYSKWTASEEAILSKQIDDNPLRLHFEIADTILAANLLPYKSRERILSMISALKGRKQKTANSTIKPKTPWTKNETKILEKLLKDNPNISSHAAQNYLPKKNIQQIGSKLGYLRACSRIITPIAEPVTTTESSSSRSVSSYLVSVKKRPKRVPWTAKEIKVISELFDKNPNIGSYEVPQGAIPGKTNAQIAAKIGSLRHERNTKMGILATSAPKPPAPLEKP